MRNHRQAVQTLLLQEGERILLKVTSTLVDQGLYSVVANLGSLVVRIVFLPLEEVSYAFFARSFASTAKSDEGVERESQVLRCGEVLLALMRLLCLIGGLVMSLGPPLSFFVVDTLYGSRLSSTEAPIILRAYCLYITLLAVNGVTEAFVRATITPAQQSSLNGWLVLISGAQVVSSITLLHRFGATGLVYANCVGIGLRLLYSLRYIGQFIRGNSALHLRQALPSVGLMLYLVAARLALTFAPVECSLPNSGGRVVSWLPSPACLMHGALGAALLLGALGFVYLFERAWVVQLQALWRGQLLQRDKKD
jgi:oligosaccharide translocation protein RFT1